MKTICILIAVDTESTLMTGNLSENSYAFDNNKNEGSAWEGTSCLLTTCKVGQLIRWQVKPISPTGNVRITKLDGIAMDLGKCKLIFEQSFSSEYWIGQPGSAGIYAPMKYEVTLNIDGWESQISLELMIEDD